ncbi:MAG: hypothetical protein ACLSGA_14325 [Ruminococcus sp.]
MYTNLNKLILKISDYICREEDVVQERLGETMGGKVLELESERLKAIGESIGEARGKAMGELQGEMRLGVLINRLILDGRVRKSEVRWMLRGGKSFIKNMECNF